VQLQRCYCVYDSKCMNSNVVINIHTFIMCTVVEHKGLNLRCGWMLGGKETVHVNTE